MPCCDSCRPLYAARKKTTASNTIAGGLLDGQCMVATNQRCPPDKRKPMGEVHCANIADAWSQVGLYVGFCVVERDIELCSDSREEEDEEGVD